MLVRTGRRSEELNKATVVAELCQIHLYLKSFLVALMESVKLW